MGYIALERVLLYEHKGQRWPVFEDADGHYLLRWQWDTATCRHRFAVEPLPRPEAGSLKATWRERQYWESKRETTMVLADREKTLCQDQSVMSMKAQEMIGRMFHHGVIVMAQRCVPVDIMRATTMINVNVC